MTKQLCRGGLLRWIVQLLRTLLLRIMSYFRGEPQTNYACHSLQIVPKFVPIPRVKGLPLVGTLYDLIAAGGAPQLHKYVDARHRQYGAIFRERLGGTQDAVFVSSANLMRSVFLQEGQYPQHPLPDAWTFYNKRHACQRGLFFMEGAEWLHNRRILNRLLLNGNLNWMDVHIESCTRQLVDRWQAQTEQADRDGKHYELPDLEQQLYRWSIEVLCGIMFGSSVLTCPKMQSSLNEFTQIVHKVFEHSSRLMNFPPKLAQLLRLRIWSDFESNVGEVLQQGEAIIELCIKSQLEQPQSEQEEALYHKLQAAAVPIEMIRRIFVDLVIAAGDTTAFSSQWALYALSLDQLLQRRIAQERAADQSKLLHGLIKETLRLYPVAPFIGRYLPQDVQIGGHYIEKDTLVLISLYTSGRDPSHFHQPLRVLPERWFLGNTEHQVHQTHGSLPFAIGQRSCIGRRVALKQLHSLLGKCATQFKMQCLNQKPVDCILRMVTVPDQTLRLALRLTSKTIETAPV
ncbi:cytochrome P450 315a1, mitochondrial [Drosophila grimshawi]|uniref:GH18831 n=1 Tax=Drosophila grimshawi TaxID=7222 RepID=B4JG07_DROGR|nr:cytochrome P450 315a1, mitochondrial [Drosophila grimshawi]EDV92546.1 GH18831 [Drosophila grimshawi]